MGRGRAVEIVKVRYIARNDHTVVRCAGGGSD